MAKWETYYHAKGINRGGEPPKLAVEEVQVSITDTGTCTVRHPSGHTTRYHWRNDFERQFAGTPAIAVAKFLKRQRDERAYAQGKVEMADAWIAAAETLAAEVAAATEFVTKD